MSKVLFLMTMCAVGAAGVTLANTNAPATAEQMVSSELDGGCCCCSCDDCTCEGCGCCEGGAACKSD